MRFLKRKIQTIREQQTFQRKVKEFDESKPRHPKDLPDYIELFVSLKEFCEEYNLLNDENYLRAQHYFEDRVKAILSHDIEHITRTIRELIEIIIPFAKVFDEIRNRDRYFQNSQDELSAKYPDLRKVQEKILDIDKELAPILVTLHLLRERLQFNHEIDPQTLIRQLNSLKFNYLTLLYSYVNALTGQIWHHHGGRIEITDDFILIHDESQLPRFERMIEDFEKECIHMMKNGFSLDFSEHTQETLGYTFYGAQMGRKIQDLKGKISTIRDNLERYRKLNNTLSQTYVTHMTGVDNFRKIFVNGSLASQAYLIEQGITPDPRSKGGVSEVLFDISFSFGIEMQYGEIGFIFPCSALLVDHSFYIRVSSQYSKFPELHLLHKDFDAHRNKVGTHVDFSKAVILIPKVNKIPRTEEEKEALTSVLHDYFVMIGALSRLKHTDNLQEFYEQFDIYNQTQIGSFLNNQRRYFDWQITRQEVDRAIRQGKKYFTRFLKAKMKEYRERPELEGSNPFQYSDQLIGGSGGLFAEDFEKNRDFYLNYDAESYWRNGFHRVARNPGSWLHGKDVDRWIDEHVIFYDRRFYYNIERIMRSHIDIEDLYGKGYKVLRRYANVILGKHAKTLLKNHVRGKILPTNQVTRPLQRNKDITLFKFVPE